MIGLFARNQCVYWIGILYISADCNFIVQVDLFFYREPEEAKPQEEEDAVQAPEYIADYTAGLGGEQWPAHIADASWSTDVAAPAGALPAVAAAGWTGETGISLDISFHFCEVMC